MDKDIKLLAEAYKKVVESSPSILYHVTKASNLDSILKNGLEPRLVQVPGVRTRTPRIYLFSNINAENIDMIKLFQHKIESLGTMMSKPITTPPDQYEDVAVLKVTLPKGIKVYRDSQVHYTATNTYFIANKTIDPQYLEVVYKGPIHSKKGPNLKAFTKQHGIQGKAYKTNIILDVKQTKQFYNKLTQLQKKAGNVIEDFKPSASHIVCYTLKPLKDLKFWYDAVTKDKEPFETDYFFELLDMIYEGEDVNMVFGVFEEGTSSKDYYSLGVKQEELEQILVKEFDAKIATSESEMQEVYNELVTQLGYKNLTLPL